MRSIARFIFRLGGWQIKGNIPEGLNKCIIIMAPHTSKTDFYIGWLLSKAMSIKLYFMIKKEAFVFPIAGILKAMGGIPVNRGHSQGLVKQIVYEFNTKENLHLVITPEGTRSLTEKWKKGYYHIAMATDVPVLIGFVDYKLKICGIEKVMTITGNYDEDFEQLKMFYKNIHAKHPERFNLTPQK